jgi:DNA-binding MarR family transcriptional regulator
MTAPKREAAQEIAELTFQLLANCQAKEERLAEQFDVTVAEFRCLRAFRGAREAHVGTLVQRIQLSPSRVTRILEGLEKRKYLVRSIDPADRRNIIAVLTPRGVTLNTQLEERYVRMHEEIMSGIPAELHGSLVDGLRNLLGSLTTWLTK